MKINKLILILFAFILIANTNLYSQKCYKGDYGFEEAAEDGEDREYDYKDGSYYGYAEGGDTIRIKTVLYGKRKYKLFVKTLEELQVASWRVVQNKKRTELTKKTTNEKYEYTYKTNKNGEYIDASGVVLDELGRKGEVDNYESDENGRVLDLRVQISKKIISADEVFSREVINEEVELYNGNDGSEMVLKNKKAKSVVIEIVFSAGDAAGCYGTFIGNQRVKSNKASKNW